MSGTAMAELVHLTTRLAKKPGTHGTPITSLSIVRHDQPQPRVHTVHRPSLCFLVQGAKEVTVGPKVLRYSAGHFVFSTVELPATGEILNASQREPYLCLVLEIDPALVFELVARCDDVERRTANASRTAIFTSRDDAMTDAFTRLLRCTRSPIDAEVLAPDIVRELTYRLLRGPHGDVVRQVGVADSQTRRIASAIQRLRRDFVSPLRIAELARSARMSVSSFHQHFKKVTTLSPLQYQKQLRLYEARRLLIHEGTSAADAGFRVGYESASQFSREYARYFGAPPLRDVRRDVSPLRTV
jgi:AraC-like DNA-binding protein